MSLNKGNRVLNYAFAMNEAFHQTMEQDSSVFLMGQGVESPWYVGSTATGLLERFGEERVIDTPVSENAITGAAVGAAIAGMRAVVVHPRVDFMLFGLDPVINEAANWYYMNGGKASVPVVIWGCINRGGEQAAQHSQALQAMFAHIPGLKVVMPATPYDAKGLLVSAIKDDNPVVFLDDRWLHSVEGSVPENMYEVPIGKAIVRRQGQDVTLVATSYMAHLAEKACEILSQDNIDVELIDLRTIKPLDEVCILDSVRKTGCLAVADGGWKSFGIAAEIQAMVFENAFDAMKAPPVRICLPDCPAPASRTLEKVYYPGVDDIVEKIKAIVNTKQ